MKKTPLLLLTLLLGGGANVYADNAELVPCTLQFSNGRAEIPVSESHIRTTGNVSIDYTTGAVTSTGSGTLTIYLNNENLIGASLYHVEAVGTDLEPALSIMDAVNGEVGGKINNNRRYNWDIAADASRNQGIGAVTAFIYTFDDHHIGTMTIQSIYILADLLTATPSAEAGHYTLSGTVAGIHTAQATAALADASATVIDVAGLTDTDVTLTSANPNCIFLANEGTLANEQNVCVGGEIDYLVLQDGHPFDFPAGAEALEAQYARTQPNAFGTLCLPFDVDDTDVEYYTAHGVNGEGALVLKKLSAVPAGTPVIVYNPNHEDTHDYILNAGASDLAAAGRTNGTVKLLGAFADQTIDVTQDPSASYYGIQSNQFLKATKTLNVKAFRAYLTTAAPAGTRLRLQFSGEETTAIQTLTAAEGNAVEAVCNASGLPQNGLQKGLNIVKMRDGRNVKVYVK